MLFCRVLFFVVLAALPLQSVLAQEALETSAKQAIIIDYDTGTVLFEKNADQRMPTASMSKVMTMYMVFEALKEGRLSLEDTLPVSETAWRMGGSKMFVDINSNVKVEDLVRGVIVQSGNDATIVLAEGLAGSEISFAEAMTKRAKELGMTGSNFMNASGWPDENHYSTALDLAILATAIIRDFPDYYKYYSELEFEYNGIKQGNRNPLLYRNIGGDGIKTGHTQEAGYGLIGSAMAGDRRVIMVVNGIESQSERANEAARLIQWALQGFSNRVLAKADAPLAEANIVFGTSKTIPLVVKKDVIVTLPRTARDNIPLEVNYNGPLVAPLSKDQPVGTLKIAVPGLPTAQEVPLYPAHNVEEQGFFTKTLTKMKLFFAGSS